MDEVITYLQQLGLSEDEANLYSLLVQTGPVTVRDIAIKAGIKRTTAYLYIDMLINKGLVIKVVKGSQKLVSAENPEKSLQELVNQKRKIAGELENKFPGMLQSLFLSMSNSMPAEEAEVKYYKGRSGVKKIYEDALKAKELRSYVNIPDIVNIFPENFKLFDDAIKQNPGMKMWDIVVDSPEARRALNTQKFERKFFPKTMEISSTDILIYDNKVAFINLKDSISGIILNNKELYNNFKVLFDFIWSVLPEDKNWGRES